MSQAPRQLPPKNSIDFDPAMIEFYKAVYLLWSNANEGNLVMSNKTPASATATGFAGEWAWDASYIYICISKNVWRRIAHATW